jgi:hypothetical protein
VTDLPAVTMSTMSAVRGFNYQGSWGSSGLDLWAHHDRELLRVEVQRGVIHFPGWNTVRWWLSPDAFLRNEERFVADFEDGLSVFASHGIGVIPVLFNRWRQPECDFGTVDTACFSPTMSWWSQPGDFDTVDAPPDAPGFFVHRLYRRYLDAVVGGFRTDPRILMWDLCNEPLNDVLAFGLDHPLIRDELTWLRWLADVCRALGADQPLTVGTAPHLPGILATEPIVDVLSIHPYYQPRNASLEGRDPDLPLPDLPFGSRRIFEQFLDWSLDLSATTGKPLVANETAWGDVDDAARAEIIDITLGECHKRGIGFVAYALHHSLTAGLHDASAGLVGPIGRFEFILADGSLRPGHDVFNKYAHESVTTR